MKTQVVREAFSLGGEFFARGVEITDPTIIEMAMKEHSHHLLATQTDAVAPAPVEEKAEEAAADKTGGSKKKTPAAAAAAPVGEAADKTAQ